MDNISAYRLWYEALQRSDRKKWSKRTREYLAFADGLEFDQWWEQVKEYFLPPEPFTVVPVDDEHQANEWWGEYGYDPSVKLLYVNLYTPSSILIRDFGRLVRSLAKNKAGRPAIDQTLVDLPLARPPNVPLIEKMLRCYDLWLENQRRPHAARRKLYEIGVLAKISPGYIVEDVNDHTREAAAKRELMSITASRMIKRAKTMIQNVEKGQFPVY
ncbi:hypothetical protein CKY39_25300 [Variovorax boronicumulans]|uniref:Uncharacterized protein n=1 Tax=Variovorax boronicumulans TaxID=436515 RepID=A0A250DQA8_9BURK|nr:hypothetical protein [Variovorax boronicumulans]ATA56179.1 hypothetical protein CKY39_25300 [Variovorax boronicumulans]